MELIPTRSFGRGLSSLQRQMNQLFQEFFGDTDLLGEWPRGEWFPALDVAETDQELVLHAEVPGIDPKEIEVTVTGDMLTLKGEKKEEFEEKDATRHRVERRYGRFSRSIALPSSVDPNQVKATSKDGVLTIRLGKKEESKPRSIQVKVE